MVQVNNRPWYMSITVKFILILLPIALVSTAVTVGSFGWFAVEGMRQDVVQRGERLVRFHATALSAPLWNYDISSVQRTLGTLALDPDVGRAVLEDMNGQVLARIGQSPADDRAALYVSTHVVEHRDEASSTKIGLLKVWFHDERIRRGIEVELFRELLLVFVLVTSLAIGALITFRLTIFKPLSQLLGAIRGSKGLSALLPVGWSSRDEIGEVINAYETMRRTIVDEEHARRDAQSALLNSERQFRDLIEGSIQGVLIHRDFRPLFVNQAWCDIFGYTKPAEILRLDTIDDMFAADERHRLRSIHNSQLAGECDNPIFEFKGVRRDGAEVWLQNANRLIEWEGDAAVQAVVIDVSERKRAEEQLLQAQKMEAIGQLTGGIAHDFNNLLAIIQGNIDLLGEDIGKDNSLAKAIHRATRRGAELTQRLLAFSRQQPLNPQPVDLAQLANGMLELLRRSLGETIAVKIVAEGDLWTALADPGQVENALLNLAINSRDAMPRGGMLTIGFANAGIYEHGASRHLDVAAGDYVVLTVKDTGEGMPPGVVEHAIEPFFTTKPVGAGSGLGLSMVYGFAKQSGGDLVIDSAIGTGTTISIYLPRVEAGREADVSIGERQNPVTGNEGLLLIEDDTDVRQLVRSMLERLGYRVVDVPDVEQARRELATRSDVDLVLSDVILPGGVNGMAFARELKKSRPELKLVLMSGYSADHVDRSDADNRGMILLNKPFTLQKLAETLRAALD